MSRFLGSFLSNLASIALALLLAITIWAMAVREANPDGERIIRLSVSVEALENTIVLNKSVNEVDLTLTGPENSLEGLDPRDFRASIDLSTLTEPGIASVPIQITRVDGTELAENIEQSIEPQQVAVTIDFETTKVLPVVVNTQGGLPPTHSLGPISAEPGEVTVRGPQTLIDTLKEARASFLLTSEIRETQEELRRLTIYNNIGEPVSTNSADLAVSNSQASILVEIIENESVANVSIQVNIEGRPATGYRLLSAIAEPRSILVQGPPELLSELRTIPTEAVPIGGLNESARIPLTIELPEGIERLDANPIVAEIDIERIMTVEIFNVMPEIVGLSDTLTATLPITQMQVTLFGPLDTLSFISGDDIRAEIPLFEAIEGQNIIVPVVNPPSVEGVEVRSFIPSIVTIDVSSTMTTTITDTEGISDTLDGEGSYWRSVPEDISDIQTVSNVPPIALIPRRYTL